jgi:hypothetical protein
MPGAHTRTTQLSRRRRKAVSASSARMAPSIPRHSSCVGQRHRDGGLQLAVHLISTRGPRSVSECSLYTRANAPRSPRRQAPGIATGEKHNEMGGVGRSAHLRGGYRFPNGPWADSTARGTAFRHGPWAARHCLHRARASTARWPVQCMGRRPGP